MSLDMQEIVVMDNHLLEVMISLWWNTRQQVCYCLLVKQEQLVTTKHWVVRLQVVLLML